jgi:biopolymer transport protein ExbD
MAVLWDVLYSETLEVEVGLSEEQVLERLRRGQLGPKDCVRLSGTHEWKRVVEVASFRRAAQQAIARRGSPEAAPREAEPDTQTVPQEGQEEIGFRPPRTVDVDIDMTPMVDVTFQLLLFFMLTATFTLQKSIQMPAPAEEKGTMAMTWEQLLRERILIEVDEKNNFWVDFQKVDASELVRRIEETRRRQNKTAAIVVGAEQATHEAMVTALDAAQEAGVENLILAPPRRTPQTRAFFRQRQLPRGG